MIRVALLVQPPVLHSLILRLLAGDAGVQVVDGPPDPDRPADVVVVSRDDPENDPDTVNMLFRFPRCRILSLGADARRAFLYELRPHRSSLGELSRESLLAAVRGTPEPAR